MENELLGQVIEGRYEIMAKLGEGGMSRVYLVMDKKLMKKWALKYMEVSDAVDGMTEASVLRNLDHPLLPRIVDVGRDTQDGRDYIYIVMDYVEGRSLGQVLKEQGVVSEEQAVDWATKILEALEYLHGQKPPIIYRDMKPDNVMLTDDGKLKIIDFGIAREKKKGSSSDTVALGTRGYAAPEQFGGQGQSDERTDIYCLGATLYHLVTGMSPSEPPYHMYPVRKYRPELSEGIERIILTATRSDPDRRYQSCGEFMEALRDKDLSIVTGKRELYITVSSYCFMASIILLALLIPLGIWSRDTVASVYRGLLLKSDTLSVYGDRLELICKAIEKMPSGIDGYLYILKLFSEDGIFTESEEAIWIEVWELYPGQDIKNIKDRKDEDYARICYEAGLIYWLYYGYGRDSGLNLRQSVEWFKEASLYGSGDYKERADVYYMLALFNRDITENMEASYEDYLVYFGNLEKLESCIDKGDGSMSGEVREFMKSAIDSYYRDFIKAGVSADRIEDLRKWSMSDD